MIKITVEEATESRVLIVAEGQLTQGHSLELISECNQHLATDRAVELDLFAIHFADKAGANFVRDLLTRGCILGRCSGFLQTLLGKDGAAQSREQEERQLLARLRRGDSDAFEETVRRFGGRLLAIARRFMRNEDDANDVVQDAFISAFRALDNFNGDALLSTWLHRIVVNSALMQLRREKRRAEESIDDLLPRFDAEGDWADGTVDDAAESPAALFERRDARELVRRCIDRLPENYRTVLMLRDVEELDTCETAQALGLTTTAVKVRLHRARQALKTLIEREAGSEAYDMAASHEQDVEKIYA